MYVARVSNIMGIDSKPFDPNTYVEEEEHFITDETGHKQRIRLEDMLFAGGGHVVEMAALM